MPQTHPKPEAPKLKLRDMLTSFFVPTLVGKVAVCCFGAAYALHPGEGYGWGLLAAIAFTVGGAARFLWRYRHHQD